MTYTYSRIILDYSRRFNSGLARWKRCTGQHAVGVEEGRASRSSLVMPPSQHIHMLSDPEDLQILLLKRVYNPISSPTLLRRDQVGVGQRISTFPLELFFLEISSVLRLLKSPTLSSQDSGVFLRGLIGITKDTPIRTFQGFWELCAWKISQRPNIFFVIAQYLSAKAQKPAKRMRCMIEQEKLDLCHLHGDRNVIRSRAQVILKRGLRAMDSGNTEDKDLAGFISIYFSIICNPLICLHTCTLTLEV